MTPNAGLPTEWEGSRPSPTGRRRSSIPVIELGRAATKAEVYDGLERWKARHPEAAAYLEPADVIETAMRGRAYAWYRLRLNLVHVPEALRPPQEPLDPDAAPDDWASLSDDERAAWMAGRTPSRGLAPHRRPTNRRAEPDDRWTEACDGRWWSGLLLVVVGVSAVSHAGLGDRRPGDADRSSRGHEDPARSARTRPATILQSVPFRERPGGPAIRDEFGENEELARVGQLVTILERAGRARQRPVGARLRGGGSERLAGRLLRLAAGGRRREAGAGAPGRRPTARRTSTWTTLAPLSPFDRLRCAGDGPITLDARTVFDAGYAAYDVTPAWFGGREDPSAVIGLALPEEAFGMYPDTTGTWLDAVVAPGVPMPPVDVDVRLTGRFDHPAAAACRRTAEIPAFDPPPPAGAGLPPEAPADSVAWCRGRFVITGWTITAGPERRPPVPGQVQLHRSPFGGACAGVGMDGPLRFRIDLAQPDPVWIERPGDPLRIIPRFSNGFSFVKDPEPGISDGAGLVIRDGTAFDPDVGCPGHSTCPGGRVHRLRLTTATRHAGRCSSSSSVTATRTVSRGPR